MEKNDKRLTFRLPQEMKRRLEIQAEKEKRSVSNLMIKIISDYLEQVEEQR